jgi:hypothetical protein
MTIAGSFWIGGHWEVPTEPAVCVSERCLDNAFSHEPPTHVLSDIRKRGEYKKRAQTFKNDSIFWGPKVAKRPCVQVCHNMNGIWFITENEELVARVVGMLKILGRVEFDIVYIFLRQ